MAFQQGVDTADSIWRASGGIVVQQDGHRALLRQIIHFACGKALPDEASFSFTGTGNGTIDDIDGGVDAPTETWTISFTSATDFTVTGSVSGAQPAGTVNSNYTTTGDPLTSLISFRITPGGTAFVSGDEFSFDVTLGPLSTQSSQWVLDRWSPFTTAGDGFNAIDDTVSVGTTGAPILHGQGSGSESFTVGLAPVETPASQIWNFKIRGYTGFSAAESWETNLGASDPVYTALWDNDMSYWLVVNGRRLCAAWVVSTTMHSLYAGAILPFASPQEWPYPLAVIGEKGDEESWTSGSPQFHHGIMRPDTSNGWLRRLDGSWDAFSASAVTNFPYEEGSASWWTNLETLPGDFQLLPITLFDNSSLNVYGVLDGPAAVPGFGLSPQTLLAVGADNYVAVNDISRTQREDFWALELA